MDSKPTVLTDEQKKAQSIHGYATALVIEVQWLIELANKGLVAPNTALEDIWELCEKAGIVKSMMLNTDEIACHPCNRGKLGLNGYNVHRNGREVDRVGVDMKELSKAMAFEMCPLDPMKSFQHAFNARLVQTSKGLLAPFKGTESKLSVGTGHWTGWVRAVKAGCRTPFKDLAGHDGRLLPDRFAKKDHRMKTCIEVGWEWRVFPWQAEVAWTGLPDLCQRALNSSHTVSSRSTELEVMVWTGEACGDKTQPSEFDELMKACAMSGPPCASYIRDVGELALQIGGGPASTNLFFLDRLGKLYGENKSLGQEFVQSLNAMSASKTEKMIWLKVACFDATYIHI